VYCSSIYSVCLARYSPYFCRHLTRSDPETSNNPIQHPVDATRHNAQGNGGPAPLDNGTLPAGPAQEPPVLPHSVLYSRLVPFYTLFMFFRGVLTLYLSKLDTPFFITDPKLVFNCPHPSIHVHQHLSTYLAAPMVAFVRYSLHDVSYGSGSRVTGLCCPHYCAHPLCEILFLRLLRRNTHNKLRYSGMSS
jgi:hypothetical protein